jgi:hypothetical protein
MRRVLAGIAVLGSLVTALALQSASGAPRTPGDPAERLVLRLPDLPPGYGNGYLGEGRGDDGLLCEAFSRSSDRPDPVARFARTYRAKGCIAAYSSYFTIPGQEPVAPVVFSGVIALGSAAAANDAWDLVPTMLGRLLPGGQPPPEVETSVKIGAQTRLFHTAQFRYPFLIRGKRKTSFLVWRSGNTIAAIVATDASFATEDRVVAELAPLQQAHIRKPTPYTAAERFDGEVALDDPALETPAYWLGRNFRPDKGLPDNRLFASFPLNGSEEEVPGALLGIWYGQIQLYTWTQATWPQYAETPAAHAIASWRCTKEKTIEIPGGYATMYGGYKKNYRRCPDEPPKAFTARIYLGGLVVAINPIWVDPIPDPPGFESPAFFIETGNPYGSFKGMEAIVRSLRLRPKPVYDQP